MSDKDGIKLLPTTDDTASDLEIQLDEDSLFLAPEAEQSIQIASKLKTALEQLLGRRDMTIEVLENIATALDESQHKTNISKVSGASAALVGTSMAVVGFGLAFVTFGASLLLTAAGGVTAAAGAVTITGADIGNWVVSKTNMKRAQETLDLDRKATAKVRELAEKLFSQCEALSKKYPNFPKETILTLVTRSVVRGGKIAKGVYDGYKLLDSTFDIARNVYKIGQVGRAGFVASRTAWASLSVATRSLSIIGVVFDVVSIPLDLFVIVKSSIEIHKYRTGRGTNSSPAKRIRDLIEGLEEHKDQMLKLQRDLFGSETSC